MTDNPLLTFVEADSFDPKNSAVVVKKPLTPEEFAKFLELWKELSNKAEPYIPEIGKWKLQIQVIGKVNEK